MADFSKLVITTNGQSLIAKLIAGTVTDVEFTTVAASSATYDEDDLEALEELSDIEQTVSVSKVTVSNDTAVKVEAAFTNSDLTTGYYMRTIGLYANDPDEGEILYAATVESTGSCYIPAYNGVSTTGVYLKLITTVGNSDNVNVELDPAAVATIGDIEDLQEQISELQAYIGYPDSDDIYGVEVDFTNSTFTRLAAAVGLEGGEDFDDISMFGGRKRCNLADDGTVNAYYGDDDFAVDGSNGQVMVEQPKFYYKVVPVTLDKHSNGSQVIRKARYYVSATQHDGFSLHPAFVERGNENDVIYLAAFEGCLYDTSASAYITDDSQVMDTDADLLSSIAYAQPASGATSSQLLYRSAARALAQNRGAGWEQWYAATVAASQMLMLIEYATFNMQDAIGDGIVDKSDGSGNESENTGATVSLGNASGTVTNSNGYSAVSYRGEENFWGNIWSWVDGMNIENPSDWSSSVGEGETGNLYIADYDFADDSSDLPYRDSGIHPAWANSDYVSAFGYSEDYDWLFIPGEALGDSSAPVGDGFWNYSSGWRVARLGGRWYDGSLCGGFCWNLNLSSAIRHRTVGGRLVYVPSKAS